MNLSFSELPSYCDVLVVGAGPAGSAAATLLAREGLYVVLVDQRSFPRDKTCGDGLIPDTHAALARLGVLDQVMARAQRVSHVRCVAPGGGRVDVPGTLAVLPRRELDDIVCRNAVQSGARMHAPVHFEAPLIDAQGRVCGARLSGADASGTKSSRELRAEWVVMATGAVPQAMVAAGLCERQAPSALALRAYVKNDAMVGRITELDMVWHRLVRKGYGWIFPCGDGVFNIGVSLFDSHLQRDDGKNEMRAVNLREVFTRFCNSYEPARLLMKDGVVQGGMKGAPLRCSLDGARYSRAGLLATGEAIGSTYAFTGEGIGKAMETGMLAAQSILQAQADDQAVQQHYEAGLLALKPKFDLYARANRINGWPWLVDLVLWRARKSPRLMQRMSGALNETSNPGNLFSLRGVMRLFTS